MSKNILIGRDLRFSKDEEHKMMLVDQNFQNQYAYHVSYFENKYAAKITCFQNLSVQFGKLHQI